MAASSIAMAFGASIARRSLAPMRHSRFLSQLTSPVTADIPSPSPTNIGSSYDTRSPGPVAANGSKAVPAPVLLPLETPKIEASLPTTIKSPLEHPDQFWRKIPMWKNVGTEEFLSYRWGTANVVQGNPKLFKFLTSTLPSTLPKVSSLPGAPQTTETREELIEDIFAGISAATMAIRMTPYVLSRINWANPRQDPVFRQFVPTKSSMLADHPKLTLDSLHETSDSPVKGLVHRYTDRTLFLPTSVCPTYCMFCTRSYAVGANTEQVTKASLKPTRSTWESAFSYIENTTTLRDVVVSGGDSYYLQPDHIDMIGDRLISIPHIRRFRFASRGMAVSPNRILDKSDPWADAIIRVAKKARRAGKHMALHTHFNHPNEISWITEMAARRLHEEGVTVRNQSVLLRGVNDSVKTMGTLIHKLANNNIFPCDMVKSIEHLRTPLSTIIDMEACLRGSIAGFLMPQFVIDLPGGGGKRLASTYETYDAATGKYTYLAPSVTGRGKESKIYEYYDPLGTAGAVRGSGLSRLRVQQAEPVA
ncbi:L-lysine 2 3-aminomutase [Ceratocystis lukuohia]|uniref:L-lysine 2 3-aminomutase n=1 Tax=Ceratocystis lukuohia TaxID=2019550 RepID=A0ABR4MSS1_9PEZI